MSGGEYVRVKPDAAGEWRWTRYGANHEPLSSSTEGYKRHAYALQQARILNPGVPVIGPDDPVPTAP